MRTRPLELDLRLGLGARQYYANGLLNYHEHDGTDTSPDRLTPAVDDRSEGVEGTIVALARLSRWVTISSELDGLFPFGAPADEAIYTWRNQVNLRLIRYISLVYRLQVRRDPFRDVEEPLKTTHDVQLRFSYSLL